MLNSPRQPVSKSSGMAVHAGVEINIDLGTPSSEPYILGPRTRASAKRLKRHGDHLDMTMSSHTSQGFTYGVVGDEYHSKVQMEREVISSK